ncbi:MAG: PBP1A family penicillin-binding protein [Alphaproteobacteria bacterium]|nr:PBP1A family penicillin-binding protein [Alphaproteobacteria bacterium]
MTTRRATARGGGAGGSRRRLGTGTYWFLVLATWTLIIAATAGAWYASDLPPPETLRKVRVAPLTLTYADGTPMAVFGRHEGAPVRLADVAPRLHQAIIATEDRRFYEHFGIDILGIARAALVNAMSGEVRQGGSTITQQLAKNLFLAPSRTLRRKAQELLLALWIESEFSKDQILELYLNHVYFGAGAWGVEAAAQTYFGKRSGALTVLESAVLAGLVKAPSHFAPATNPTAARTRARAVLDNMVEAGFLTADQREAALRDKLMLAPASPLGGTGYFADWVLDQVPDYVGSGGAGLRIVTTLDPEQQRVAEQAIGEAIATYRDERRVGQGALVALAGDGAVRAMVGGAGFAASPFNRAVDARRQPGSAFKLFVYLAGFEAGLHADDVFQDEPTSVAGWRPTNYDGTYAGAVTLRQAFARSINTVAVQVAERAGRGQVMRAAARLGIGGALRPHPSLALGSAEVSLLELTAAYAAIANGGRAVLPYGIREIHDATGAVVYRRQGSGPGRAVRSAVAAALTDLLVATIREGTGRTAAIDRPAAGKTGTSQDFRDAWFIGFSADLVAGVWFGNDDGAPMKGVTGGTVPASTWAAFMRAAHRGLPPRALGSAGTRVSAVD